MWKGGKAEKKESHTSAGTCLASSISALFPARATIVFGFPTPKQRGEKHYLCINNLSNYQFDWFCCPFIFSSTYPKTQTWKGGEGKSSAEGKINSQQCKQGNALTLFLPKWFSRKYEIKKIVYMEHHTRGKLNEQVQVEKVRLERCNFFSQMRGSCASLH